jgi:hypothetical protein
MTENLMTDTWRFIVVVCLLVAVGTLLPFAVEAGTALPAGLIA